MASIDVTALEDPSGLRPRQRYSSHNDSNRGLGHGAKPIKDRQNSEFTTMALQAIDG